jgi:nitrile hydratase
VNGIHDMGGMHGFGAVEIEADEPVFHARWEARVFGMSIVVLRHFLANIDARRHGLERLDPVTYLANGYYGRWFARLERELLEHGALREGELDARAAGAASPAAPVPERPAPPPPPAHPFLRDVDRAPAFRVGDRVRARNHQPTGHTRLPAYARSRRGVVARAYPACVLPDTNAHLLGENPEFVYAVRFEGRELWGECAEPGTCVHVDLFESYLDPDPGA